MTLDEFLEQLGQLDLTAFSRIATSDSSIRLAGKGGAFCPVTAVCFAVTGDRYRPSQFAPAAVSIGVSVVDMAAIVDAADNLVSSPLREKLQHAVARLPLRSTPHEVS